MKLTKKQKLAIRMAALIGVLYLLFTLFPSCYKQPNCVNEPPQKCYYTLGSFLYCGDSVFQNVLIDTVWTEVDACKVPKWLCQTKMIRETAIQNADSITQMFEYQYPYKCECLNAEQ